MTTKMESTVNQQSNEILNDECELRYVLSTDQAFPPVRATDQSAGLDLSS
jgi:hypothetical protein